MLSRIHAYLREAPRPFREIVQIGPFCATFSPDTDLLFVNYAIPDDEAEPTPTEIQEFIAACEARNRVPRLEYIPALAPAVEPALLSAGFVEERRCPLMTCAPSQQGALVIPSGFEIVFPESDPEISGLVTVLYEAYGEPGPGADDVKRQREFLEKGGVSVLARETATGEPAGGGSYTVPVSGVTEIAGIGVRERYRRLGLGQAITVFLTQEAFRNGITFAFLSAATETEARIYARAGYKPAGEILLISRPTT